jgi:GT2 family glycosyltransferase
MRTDIFPELKPENPDKYKNGKVAIIITNQDPFLVRKCVDHIVKYTNPLPEILVGHTDKFIRLYNGKFPECKVFSLGKWNYSSNNNFLATQTDAETLIFLNDDCFVTEGWLEPILEDLAMDVIGQVGAQLRFPDGRIQHAGVIFRKDKPEQPIHAFLRYPNTSEKVNSMKAFPAVTGALIGIRHSLHDAIGGFHEGYQIELNDVDYSIKVWAYGKDVVYDNRVVGTHITAESRKEANNYNIILEDRKLLQSRCESFCREKNFI